MNYFRRNKNIPSCVANYDTSVNSDQRHVILSRQFRNECAFLGRKKDEFRLDNSCSVIEILVEFEYSVINFENFIELDEIF